MNIDIAFGEALIVLGPGKGPHLGQVEIGSFFRPKLALACSNYHAQHTFLCQLSLFCVANTPITEFESPV
jgi:hypothetical protein